MPYYGYSRQDRKDQPRVAIGAKLMANIITLTTLLSLATISITLWLTDMLF